MNYLLSFQFCLNFGNLCIYRDVSITVKVEVAAVCFCLIEIVFCKHFTTRDYVFTLTTFKTFIFASAIEGRLEIFFLCCNYPFSKKALIFQGKFMK